MGKLNFVNSRKETQRGIQLTDGRIISLYDKDNHFYLRFDKKIDLENGTYEEDGIVSLDDSNSTCLNNLIRHGAREVRCYDECNYNENVYPSEFNLNDEKVKKIQKYFKEHGFNVTKDAIFHQLSSWMNDYKSGYRDEVNGYHLFSPCGCNPLSIRLSTLNKLCSDWQTTYFC